MRAVRFKYVNWFLRNKNHYETSITIPHMVSGVETENHWNGGADNKHENANRRFGNSILCN